MFTAGLSPHVPDTKTAGVREVKVKHINLEPKTSSTKKIAQVSFEDYHTTWSGIATSKSNPQEKNPRKHKIYTVS